MSIEPRPLAEAPETAGAVAAATRAPAPTAAASVGQGPVHAILWTMCLAHFLNDLLQSLLSAALPVLKTAYSLDFTRVGFIAAAFQISASLLQPFVGLYTDRRAMPYGLPVGMLCTLCGLLLLAFASTYALLLVACVFVGLGSAIFHPEGSRVTRMAAGGRLGQAQSTFQVGGNFGQASGPLLAAFVVAPLGQRGIAWFAFVGLFAALVLFFVARWYAARIRLEPRRPRGAAHDNPLGLSNARLYGAVGVLLLLTFSKSFYSASISTFYTFFLMQKFALDLRDAQLYLFLFMGSVAAGVYFGGPIGDRLGRKYVIWASILGALPFTAALPYVNLPTAAALTVCIGFIMSASMSQIVVFALELVPSRVGLVSGLFFGMGFGMAGLGAALLGWLADKTSLDFVFKLCAWLPAIGLATIFLPDTRARARG